MELPLFFYKYFNVLYVEAILDYSRLTHGFV